MLERIIFAIDDDSNTYNVMKFLKYVSQEQALGRMGKMQHLIGCYKGTLENSYMILAKDLPKIERFISNQESILRIPGDLRQPCALEFVSSGDRVSIGVMREVTPTEALRCEAWTYVIETGKYFVCGGN